MEPTVFQTTAMPAAVTRPRSLLIVDDEPLIAMMIEDMAIELGWTVAWIAHNERSAFHLLETTAATLAVLDVNLGPNTSCAFAAACRDRHIPVLFITGYTTAEIPEGCGNAPVLSKPFSPSDFEIALGRCLRQTEGQPTK